MAQDRANRFNKDQDVKNDKPCRTKRPPFLFSRQDYCSTGSISFHPWFHLTSQPGTLTLAQSLRRTLSFKQVVQHLQRESKPELRVHIIMYKQNLVIFLLRAMTRLELCRLELENRCIPHLQLCCRHLGCRRGEEPSEGNGTCDAAADHQRPAACANARGRDSHW